MMYTLLPERPVQFGDDGKFVASFNENCFDITLTVVDGKEDNKQLTLDVSPQEAGGYEIVVSFVVAVNGVEHWVDFDLWKTAEIVWKAAVQTAAISVGFRFEVHDVLAPSDLRTGGGFRNFRILCSKGAYFVNTTELNNLGGSLFASWHRRELEGESAVAVTELHEDELDALLKACCAYSTVVITKRNFEVLLPIAWKFKIVGVLRAIERFLSNSKGIHAISKLDFAHRFQLALLATDVLRSLGGAEQRREAVRDYLTKRGLDRCPNHLLEMLELIA